MERLNLNHLWYFYVTAKEGSVKEAAEKLHVSQPTISDQIRNLEEFLNTKLFERRNRALFLTEQGERALDYSEKIFSLSFELTRVLKNKEKLYRDSLVIGLTPFMSNFFNYETIVALLKKSQVRVDFVENHRHLLLADLEAENIDIVFATSNESLPPNVVSTRVGLNRTYAVAHKKFKKYQKNFPHALDEIPYFGHTEGSHLKYNIDLFFGKLALSPKVIGRGDSLELFSLTAEKGLAFVIVSEMGMERMIRNKDLVVLGELEELQTSVFAMSKPHLSREGQDLIENLKQKTL